MFRSSLRSATSSGLTCGRSGRCRRRSTPLRGWRRMKSRCWNGRKSRFDPRFSLSKAWARSGVAAKLRANDAIPTYIVPKCEIAGLADHQRPDEQGSTRQQDREDRPRKAGGVARRNRRVSRQGAGDGSGRDRRPARAAGVRARRHHEPPADLGRGLPAAGPDVPGGRHHRRARRAAGLFPRSDRMPRRRTGWRSPSGSAR